MAEVRFVFGELRTGRVLEEIDLQGTSAITTKLNDWGSLKGTFTLDQSGKSNSDLVGAVVPGKNFVAVERNGEVIWGGIVWGYTYQSQSKTVQLSARTLEAYFERVRIRVDWLWTDIERRNIFIDLVNYMQLEPEYDLGLVVPSDFPDASLATVDIKAIDRQKMFNVISSIADGVEGFDWRIAWTKSETGYYLKTLLIGDPDLGNGDPTRLNFDYPGSIVNYYETTSMSEAGTHVSMVGAGFGDTLLTSEVIHQDMIDSGSWLAYDLDVSAKTVTDQIRLDTLAQKEAARRRPPMVVTKVFLKADADPDYASYALGDACYVNLLDAKHPNGVTSLARIVATSYTPPTDDSTEEVELIFEGDNLNE